MTVQIDTEVTAQLIDQVRVLTDRAEIAQLCDRYVTHMDKDRDSDDWLDSVFSDDIVIVLPTGEYHGMTRLMEFQQMARVSFARSHHISSNYAIELTGDRAKVRAHLIAVHVVQSDEPRSHFDVGGHYEAVAVRTADGWRLSRLDFQLVWMSGEPPAGAKM